MLGRKTYLDESALFLEKGTFYWSLCLCLEYSSRLLKKRQNWKIVPSMSWWHKKLIHREEPVICTRDCMNTDSDIRFELRYFIDISPSHLMLVCARRLHLFSKIRWLMSHIYYIKCKRRALRVFKYQTWAVFNFSHEPWLNLHHEPFHTIGFLP